jgi:hypothetical protein
MSFAEFLITIFSMSGLCLLGLGLYDLVYKGGTEEDYLKMMEEMMGEMTEEENDGEAD